MPKSVTERADILPMLGEVFREHGYGGASLAIIGERTGLGKGSLYHFFPGGKEEMAEAVLAEIDGWFQRAIFTPLRTDKDAARAIVGMFKSVDDYFRSGRRICLIGALALNDARDVFAKPIQSYFARWQDALAGALVRAGHRRKSAGALSEQTLAAIQGALILARALDDPTVFTRALVRERGQLLA